MPRSLSLSLAVLALVIVAGTFLSSDRSGEKKPPAPFEKPGPGKAVDGNRLAYLDDFANPYWPTADGPRLTTPQWIGEPGVDAVAVLSIDDMREPAKYEAFLRPILDALREHQGDESGLSIFTNTVDPGDPQLQTWLEEGVSIEVHTIDHPCPLLQNGDFSQARATVHRCIDLLAEIPNSRPVAYRMPCCDSMNSVSPRFFQDIFTPQTEGENHLTVDSSVFVVFPDDRFRKYLPLGKDFVNVIENYPYPYVIGGNCWELPCTVPSDWEAQFLHGVNNPETVADLQAAIDHVVAKRGLFTFVFHPHGWIENTQVAELVEHAADKHGGRVKFLSARQVQERIDRHLLGGRSLRLQDGARAPIRVLDLDHDGFMDVLIQEGESLITRLWHPESGEWEESTVPGSRSLQNASFGVVQRSGRASFLAADGSFWHFGEDDVWRHEKTELLDAFDKALLRDLDGDGRCEVLIATGGNTAVFEIDGSPRPFPALELDEVLSLALRFLDLDTDGDLDAVYSDAVRFAVHLFESKDNGWRLLSEGSRGEANASVPPAFVRADGSDNGVWVHQRAFIIQNEDTAGEPNVIRRVRFDDILSGPEPEETLLDSEPRDPEESLSQMQTKSGLRIDLAAAEPLVMDPVDIAWGADGRLWVVEMADYPSGIDGQGKPGGRVRVLEDTDADGRYDSSTVFLDELPFPTGVMPWREGALVVAAPDVLFARDEDGDGMADRREVLYTGFREGNQQHRVNGLRWGLDNWVYLANGDSGGTIRSTKTGETLDLGSHDLRIRPDTGEMELLSGETQFGRNRDDAGEWFGCNNSNTIWHYALEERYLQRNPHMTPPDPRVYIAEERGNARVYPTSVLFTRFNDLHTANRITSACSTNIYRDDRLGSAYAGNAFICEPVHNLVHRQVLTEHGATFASRRAADETNTEFLTSRDPWFRPVAVHTGPDGALWVVDMYRLVIEHPEWIPREWQEQLDLRSGSDRGRLFRVVKEGAPLAEMPDLSKASDLEVIEYLADGSGTVRDLAHRVLVQARGAVSDEGIRRLWVMAVDHERWQARLHALCVLDGLDALSAEDLRHTLEDGHPAVRKHAVRLLAEKGPHEAMDARGLIWDRLKMETDPKVRRQLGYALGYLGDLSGAGTLLADNDPFVRAAAISSALADLDGFAAALKRDLGDGNPARDAGKDAVTTFTNEKRFDLLEGFLKDVIAQAAGALQPWHFDLFSEALDGSLPDDRRSVLVQQLKWLAGAAADMSSDLALPATERCAALTFLFRIDPQSAEQRVTEWIAPGQELALQQVALELAARQAPEIFVKTVRAEWESFEPAMREIAGGLLAARTDLARRLLDLIDADEGPVGIERLLSRHPDPSIQKLARERFIDQGTERVILSPAAWESYRVAARDDGDAEEGRQLFETNCAICHEKGDLGKPVGPDLMMLSDRSNEALLIAILDPNRAVEDKYLAYEITQQDGSVTMGLLEGEAGGSVRVRLANGETQTLSRHRIASLRSTGLSLMPEGFATALDPVQMNHLLAYLQASSLPPKSFAGNAPEEIAVGTEETVELPASKAAIYGPSLVFESAYENLGFWGDAADRAVWTLRCAEEASYKVWLDFACADDTAGNRFIFSCDADEVEGRIPGTGGWDVYQRRAFGEVTLKKGVQELVLKPSGTLRGYLMDLRTVKLTRLTRPDR